MKALRLSIIIIMIWVMVFINTGCWNYVDVDQLFVVSGIGISKGENSRYRATFEVGKAPLSPDGETSIKNPSAEGDTIFDAIRNVIVKIGSKLYWGHTNLIIIEEEVAKEGITEILGTLDRASDLSSDVVVAVTMSPVTDIFAVEDPIHDSNSYHIADFFEDEEASGKSMKRELMESISDIMQNTGSLSLPLFHVEMEGDEPIIAAGGAVAFRGEKMVGRLSEIETRSLAILKGDIVRNYALTVGDHDNISPITVEVVSSHRKVKVDVTDRVPRFDIDLKIISNVASLQSAVDYITDTRIDVMEKRLEKQLRDELMRTIDKAQMEFRADIFFFGDFVFDNHPEYWRTFAPHWNDQFVYAYFNVDVDVDIMFSGTHVRPIREGQ